MKYFFFFFAVVIAGQSGCISTTTLHPLLEEKDLSEDLDLHGEWVQVDLKEKQKEPNRIKLNGAGESYELNLGNNQKQLVGPLKGAEFEILVGQIGEQRYFQIRRTDQDAQAFLGGVFPFAFGKFEVRGELLTIYPVNDNVFKRLAKEKSLSHMIDKTGEFEQSLVVTATTKKLQAFIKANEKELFEKKPFKYRRSKASKVRKN